MSPPDPPRPSRIVLAETKRREAGQRAAAAGSALEASLEQHHAAAALLKLAEVRRVSPHVLHLGPGRLPGTFSARFDAPGGCDYRGTLRGGRALVAEAKSTQGATLAWSDFTEAERADMAAASELGALCLVLWRSAELAALFAVPWQAMPWKKSGAGQGVRAVDVEEWRVREAPYLRRFVEGR